MSYIYSSKFVEIWNRRSSTWRLRRQWTHACLRHHWLLASSGAYKVAKCRFPTLHLKMPVFKAIAAIRNPPKHPKQISRLQSRPLAFVRMCRRQPWRLKGWSVQKLWRVAIALIPLKIRRTKLFSKLSFLKPALVLNGRSFYLTNPSPGICLLSLILCRFNESI